VTLATVKREIGSVFHKAVSGVLDVYDHTIAHDITPFRWEDYTSPLNKAVDIVKKGNVWTPWKPVEYAVKLGEEYGNSELDVLLEKDSQLTFSDFKVKWEFKRSDYETQFWQEIETDWQMLHYVWAVEKKFNTTLDVFGVTLVVLTPKVRVVHRFFPVKRHLIEWFAESAPQHWSIMQQQEFLYQHQPGYRAPMSNNHRGRYGLCKYYEGCMVYQGKPELLQIAYDRRERGK
jgi:hypothetical protein